MPVALLALSVVAPFLLASDPAPGECRVGPLGTLSVGQVLGPVESEVRPGFDDTVALLSTRPGGPGTSPVPSLPGAPAFSVRSGLDSLALDRVPRASPNLSYAVFRFRLVQAAEVRITAGIPGETALFLDGRKIRLHGGGPGRDDAWADVALGAGRHAILVRSFRRGGDPGDRVVVRLLGRDNRPLPDVRLAWPDGLPPEGCLLGTTVEPDLTATPDGASGALSFGLPDRRPVREGSLTVSIETPPPSSLSTPSRIEVPIPTEPTASVPITIRLPPGKSWVRVRVQAPDGRLDALVRNIDLRHRPEAVATLVEARSRIDGSRPFALDSLQARVNQLDHLLGRQDPDDAWVDAVRQDLAASLAALNRGQPPYLGRTGVLDRAYRSPIDGSLRPVTLKVPAIHAADPSARLPLVVMLHGTGFGPRLTLRQLFGRDRDRRRETPEQAERHLPPLPEVPFLIACPWGFGNIGARYLGEEDLFHAIEAIASEYPVDPDRVYLAGLSLGGLGTFHAGLRYPDRFAALATAAGYASVAQYADVAGRPQLPWEAFLVNRNDDVRFAANGLYLPLWATHGRRDRPERTTVLVDRYRELGYPVVYREYPTGHEVWAEAFSDQAVFDWLATHRRPERPAIVRFTTGSGRSREAFWLRIEAFVRSDALARIEGEAVPGPGTGCDLRIDTDNVRGLTVDVTRLPTACAAPFRVRVDGVPILAAGPPLSIIRESGTWRLADVSTPAGLRKRPGLSGPVDDAFHGPMIFVYGTADPLQTAVNRARAEADSTLPFLRADVRFPVRSDSELTPEESRDATIVLYGNPGSNRVLARIADRLPIRFESDAILVGPMRYAGEDVGTVFIAPNPDCPDHYVLVKAGTTWRGTLLSRHLPLFLPDYVVFDERVARQTGGRLMDRRPALDGGFFDEEWRVARRKEQQSSTGNDP